MPVPNLTKAPNTTGQIKNNTAATIREAPAVTIATDLLPLKKASASGSLVFLNLL